MVKSAFTNLRWKWLRLVLAVLLPLHTGYAQAAMVMQAQSVSLTVEASQVQSQAGADPMTDGMPCHHQAESSPAPDHSSGHQGGCCDAGSCHCAAACGLAFTLARIAPQPGSLVSPFTYLSVLAVIRPPDLRPPIA